MKSFNCHVCGNPLFFENSVCVSCGTALGFSRAERAIVPVDEHGRHLDADGRTSYVCVNLALSGCTWLTEVEGGQCASCDLTRTRPADSDDVGMANLLPAERAKRHLIVELDRLGFPVVGKDPATGDPENGLCFDLLSSVAENVVIGHDDGVITIDLAESDAVYRERVRDGLAEPYRTMLGHFRHEIGHYYEWQLVRGPARIARCRELFGDETIPYQEAADRYYANGAPADWADSHISAYAAMHPFEDFAETWAHFLHICDTIETAGAYGLTDVPSLDSATSFRSLVVKVWMPMTTALNMINRSMGNDDLYPFVIPSPVLDKLDFIASLRLPEAPVPTG